jgi:hypothetical protein
VSTRYPTIGEQLDISAQIEPGAEISRESARELPAGIPLTHPYWLREPGTVGMFRVDDPSLIGMAENPPAFPIEHVFSVGGAEIVVHDEPMHVFRDPVKGEVRRRMEIVPPVTLAFAESLALFAPNESKSVLVDVTASKGKASGTIRLAANSGWRISPAEAAFEIATAGGRASVAFTITAPKKPISTEIGVSATVDGIEVRTGHEAIEYDHIPRQLLQRTASLSAVCLELEILGKKIGYLHGAGDLVPESLQRMGYDVTLLSNADLTEYGLSGFDAVVFGVRVFNTREDIGTYMPAVFNYAKAGGTVVVQYNTAQGLSTDQLAPFPLSLSRDRVTDENAKITILAPDHVALNSPNTITLADFDGWVQERGLYFPGEWDERFIPIIACNDPGETSKSGSLLVAEYGEGYFVYSGISWFRELPAGVPGAYRLFANLVSLGK